MADRYEVVVVGAGLAGLSAARALRGRRVLVLEAEDRIGGRVQSLRRDPYWLNLGAHIIAGEGSLTRDLAGEFGLPIVTPPGDVLCIAMGGRIVRAKRAEEMPFRLPLSLSARMSLARIGLRLRRGSRRTRRADTGQMLTSPLPGAFDALPVDPGLDAMSMRSYLGRMHPDVEALIRVSVNRAGGELDDTSANYAIQGLFGAFTYRRANIVGGTERLVQAIAGSIPEVLLSARVSQVRQLPADGVAIAYERNGLREEVEATGCILAVPAPIAARILRDAPTWKQSALSQIRYAPYVVAGIFTTESSTAPWDGLYAMAVPDASFCMLFNPGNALAGPAGRPPGGALVVYAAAERARAMLGLPATEVERRFVTDLVRLFPGSGPQIGDVTVVPWEFGAPTPGPGRARLQPALAASVGRIAFAGDYLQYAGLDSAMRSGLRAARLAEAWLA